MLHIHPGLIKGICSKCTVFKQLQQVFTLKSNYLCIIYKYVVSHFLAFSCLLKVIQIRQYNNYTYIVNGITVDRINLVTICSKRQRKEVVHA